MTFEKLPNEPLPGEDPDAMLRSLNQGRPHDDPIEDEPLTAEERDALHMILGGYKGTPEQSANTLHAKLFDYVGNPKLEHPVMDSLCRKFMLERGSVTQTVTWGNTRETENRTSPRIVVRLTPKAHKALSQ